MSRRAVLLSALPLLAGALGCGRPPKAELDPKATLTTLQRARPEVPPGDLATALTALAWRTHPDLAAAKADLEAAKAGIRTAQARPNPSFGFGATKAEGVPQPWTLTYGLNLPIELGGKRRFRVKLAKLQVEAAELGVAETAWSLRSGVRATLVDWQQAREALRSAEEEATLRGALLKLQEQRFAAGEIGAPERATANLEAQRAEAARLTARTGLDRAEAALALAAGTTPDALRTRLAAEPGPDLQLPPAPAERADDALVHRLEVRQVLVDWDRNETTLDLELAKRIPDLQVGPAYSLDQGVKKWTLGFTVELPVFDRRQGPIAEAVARRSVLEARLRQVEARALSEAGLARSREADARARLQAALQVLAESRARLAVAQRAFDLGGSDRGELLAAKLEALQARGLAVDAWAETRRARLALEDAFQKPLDPAEQPYPFDEAPR